MQYAVPQFTEVEDKLIGPLTLKQFLTLLAAGGIDLFFWSLLGFSIFFFLFALPITLLGLSLAFGSFNGRPMYGYIGAFINYTTRPQARIFIREEPNFVMKIETKKPQAAQAEKDNESAESRLKKLAYLLDQKTQEEQELIDQKTDIR